MGWVVPVLTTVGGIIVVSITVILHFVLNKQSEKRNVRPNSPLIEIKSERIKRFTNNYTRGIKKTEIKRRNGTTYFEFYPIDVEQGIEVKRPDIIPFIVKDEYIHRQAEGDDLGRRQIITILPRSKKDMPKKLRDTFEGDFLEEEGQKAWLEATFGKAITSGDKAISHIMTKYARGELSKMQQKDSEEYIKNIIKNLTEGQKQGDSTNLNKD